MTDMPPEPELPKEVLDAMALTAARFDQHGKTLEQWAEMAQGFYRELMARFEPNLAATLLVNWQTVFFSNIYAGNLDQEEGDGGQT